MTLILATRDMNIIQVWTKSEQNVINKKEERPYILTCYLQLNSIYGHSMYEFSILVSVTFLFPFETKN